MPHKANEKPICGALSVSLPALGLLVGFIGGLAFLVLAGALRVARSFVGLNQ